MRRAIQVCLLFIAILCGSLAEAGTYKVQKGDCLSRIAPRFGTTWQKLAADNNLNSPYVIYAGQELQVPTATNLDSQQAYHWRNPGSMPFGRRDWTKAIKSFDLPDEVKSAIMNKLDSAFYKAEFDQDPKWQDDAFEWTVIKPGDVFHQMVFGDYRIKNNVVADWSSDKAVAARMFTVEVGGEKYYFFEPLVCRNWSWRTDALQPQIGEAKPRMKMLLPLPPSPFVEDAQVAEVVNPMPTEDKNPIVEQWIDKASQIINRTEMSVGGGREWGVDGGQTDYWWGNLNFFPGGLEIPPEAFLKGIALQADGFAGQSSDGFNYSGSYFGIGGVFKKASPNVVNEFKVTVGKREDFGDISSNAGTYEDHQETKMLRLFASRENKSNHEHWFPRSLVYGDVGLDIGHEKSATWTDASGQYPITVEPGDKTFYRLGADLDIWQNNKSKELVFRTGGVLSHRLENSNTGLQIKAGAVYKEILEVFVSATDNNVDADSRGISVGFNISNLIKRWLNPDSKEEEGRYLDIGNPNDSI